jgi:hypothetical protein
MSDEFNVEGRTFKDGHDPLWTALDKSDDDSSQAGGGSLQFYNSSAVTTTNGFMKIATILGKTQWNRYDHIKKTWKHVQTNFTSGMVQSWEKFCFTGGIVEVGTAVLLYMSMLCIDIQCESHRRILFRLLRSDVVFPGDPYIGGLWPAVWMLGNLGRATYEASTNNIWPWSFDICDRELQPAQTISACNAQNHFGMNPYQGRGATEIDIVEVMTGYSKHPLPATKPPLNYPYGDLTLQVCLVQCDVLPQMPEFILHFFSLLACILGCSRCLEKPTANWICSLDEKYYLTQWTHGICSSNVVQRARNVG